MTKLIYLENQNLYETKAKVLEISDTENGRAIILDQTIFYVQGGGQPGDKGRIANSDGIFEVTKTVFNEDGLAIHMGNFVQGSFEVNAEVGLKVDVTSRKLNSKIHSAGHLIDLAVKNSGLNWKSGKSYHYPEGSYIEYTSNTIENLNSKIPDLIEQINQEYNLLVKQSLPFEVKLDKSQSYKGQPLRIVSIAGLIECPCSGTHVSNSSELSGFKITKIKVKLGTIRLSYN
ncbi:MAG: alanine--tRNA ligase-related protein [bacterium]